VISDGKKPSDLRSVANIFVAIFDASSTKINYQLRRAVISAGISLFLMLILINQVKMKQIEENTKLAM
jgi:hypothetical protein